jgi:hypothetical protein
LKILDAMLTLTIILNTYPEKHNIITTDWVVSQMKRLDGRIMALSLIKHHG